MARSLLFRLAATCCLLAVAGCFHPGTQQRDVVNEDLSVPPPPPLPLPPHVVPVAQSHAHQMAFHVWKQMLRGHLAYVVRIGLADVQPRLLFAGGQARPTTGVESFDSLWHRVGPSVATSGAFFGERSHQTLGTLVSRGRICQREAWDRRGTALEIASGGNATLRTLQIEHAAPNCQFFLQAGPRLLRNGALWLHPSYEGFGDPALLARARRVAVGLMHGGRVLLLVAFPHPASLLTEAEAMRDLGCQDAMNLDGGASAALAVGGRALIEPTTLLTHIVVFKPTVTEPRFVRSQGS